MWKSWRAPRVIVVKPSRSSLPGAASSETEPRLSRPTVLSRALRERAEEVMSEQAFAILLASSFTFGCASLHLWREHAVDLALVLATPLLCLIALTIFVALVKNVETGRDVRAP